MTNSCEKGNERSTTMHWWLCEDVGQWSKRRRRRRKSESQCEPHSSCCVPNWTPDPKQSSQSLGFLLQWDFDKQTYLNSANKNASNSRRDIKKLICIYTFRSIKRVLSSQVVKIPELHRHHQSLSEEANWHVYWHLGNLSDNTYSYLFIITGAP